MNDKLNLIDTHCHMDMVLEKGIPLVEIENNLLENQITTVIHIASDPQSMEFASKFCHENSEKIQYYYTIGIHPNEAHELDIYSGANYMENNHKDSRCIAIGEIGLDYYYGKEHRDIQIKVFEMYVEMALKYNKPVVVHTRNAHEDTLKIIKRYSGQISFLIHCFTGNASQMTDFLDAGGWISFSGIVTFKNAVDIKNAVLECPLDRIMIETDAPFLAPTPKRGQINRPSWVKYIADYIIELRPEASYAHFSENTKRFFKLQDI